MTEELQHTESGTSPPRKRQLARLPRGRQESRDVILEHEEAGGRTAARLVRVEGGGVDRTTGQALKVYFELTVKLPHQQEVTRTFSGQGDPVIAERNARMAYLMAQHSCVDFSLPVGELGERIWPEPKNLTTLAKLQAGREWPDSLLRTRMNSGDSHADSPSSGGAAMGMAWTRREGLFREVPVGQLEAEDMVTLALAPTEVQQ
jgi:hypothetical protein